MSTSTIAMSLVVVRSERDGGTHVLLGEKLRGFGLGRLVAPGGKIDADETPRQAAARELREETSLDIAPHRLHFAALLDFTFTREADAAMRAYVFDVTDNLLCPSDSEEIAARWIPVANIPYDRMWDDAAVWLPIVLRNSAAREDAAPREDAALHSDAASVEAPHLHFHYAPDGASLASHRSLGHASSPE